MEDNFLVTKDTNRNSEIQIIVKVGEKTSQEEEQSIEKLIGLCDRIICV
jgi:hypothetical protein